MKYARWFLLAVVLLATTGLHMPATTYAQPYFYRWGPATPSVTCTTSGGNIYATTSTRAAEWDLPASSEVIVTFDDNGTTSSVGPIPTGYTGIGSTVFGVFGSGSLGMSYPAYFAITYVTIIDGAPVYSSTLRGDCTGGGAGTMSITNQTVTPGESVILPGPDMVPLPEGSVGGVFVQTTPVYSAPSSDAATTTIMKQGTTVWVLGVDASGSFYQAVMSGRFFWVPVETMGPNYDNVWRGTPLPTTVVN